MTMNLTKLELTRKKVIFPLILVLINAMVFVLNIQWGTQNVWELLGMKMNEPILSRLWTVISAQFIHGDGNHIKGNMSVFAPTALYLSYKAFKWDNMYWVIPCLGLAQYAMGTRGIHGGFSGVVFFTITVALIELFQTKQMRVMDMAFSLWAFANVSFIFVLITPLPGVSFEGHLAGVIMGALYVIAKNYTVRFNLAIKKKS